MGNVLSSVGTNPLPVPAGQTLKSGYQCLANSGTTVYTVTTGKTFYCLGVCYEAKTTAGSYNINNGGTILKAWVPTSAPVLLTGGILFSAPSGQAITIVHDSGAGLGSCQIWGYEI